MTHQTGPKLVWDAQKPAFTRGNTRILLCHQRSRLPDKTILVLEEDTWRVLSPALSINELQEQPPVRVMTSLLDQEPSRPGDVVIQGTRWYAINYDLEQDPICQTQWLRQSMHTILARAIENNISSLCIPLPGVAHGHISLSHSIDIILDLIETCQPEQPLSLWISNQAEDLHEIWRQLKARAK